MVLEARGAPLSTLPQLRAGFAALAASVRGEAAAVWFELWNREFDALAREPNARRRSSRSAARRKHCAATRGAGWMRASELKPARVLMRGALPSGSFDAGFRFTVENGLEPLIIFDPAALAIGLPKLPTD